MPIVTLFTTPATSPTSIVLLPTIHMTSLMPFALLVTVLATASDANYYNTCANYDVFDTDCTCIWRTLGKGGRK
jgi:hypothetical protein